MMKHVPGMYLLWFTTACTFDDLLSSPVKPEVHLYDATLSSGRV